MRYRYILFSILFLVVLLWLLLTNPIHALAECISWVVNTPDGVRYCHQCNGGSVHCT